MQRFTAEMRRWREENQNKHLCQCGCGRYVQPTRWRWYNGRNLDYIVGHNPVSHVTAYPGRYTRPDGYVLVHVPNHPHADAKGYVREHRLVMEQKLGRYLRDDEHVHHINGKKSDNRPKNLEVHGVSEHHLLHARYGEDHPNWRNIDTEELIELRKAGRTFKQIQQELGIGINTVRRHLHKAGLK